MDYRKDRPSDGINAGLSRLGAIACIIMALVFVPHTVLGMDKYEESTHAEEIQRQYNRADSEKTDFDPDGGLNEYLKYAALHNPGLKAAFYTWRAELERVSSASSLSDPVFSYGYFVENVETRVGPQRHRLGLKQAFPWFGTLGVRKDIASEAARAAFSRYRAQKLDLYYRVKSAYYVYYLLGRRIELTRENVELLTFWESVSRTRYRADLQRHPDLIRIQVELGKLENRLAILENEIRPAVARLRATLNLPDSINRPIPADVPEGELGISDDSVKTLILAHNPNLKAFEHTVEREKAAVRLAGKSSYPNFSFSVDYIETGKAAVPGMEEGGKDPLMVSVSINLPLWFGKNRALKNEAVSRYRSAQSRMKEVRNDLAAYGEKILNEYRNSRREVTLYRDGLVHKAQQSLNVSYTTYRAGELDFLSLLDAQRQLLDFQLELDRAEAEAAIRLAELEMLAGEELTNAGEAEAK